MWVSVVPRRFVCGNANWRFDNLGGSHHQSQVNCESSVDVIILWSLS